MRNQLARPTLVLRIGFAGAREVEENRVAPLINKVLEACKTFLQSCSPADQSVDDLYLKFLDKKTPLLRLITGLAEGTDTLAWRELQALGDSTLDTELAAVLPCSIDAYLATRKPEHVGDFGDMLEACSYVQTLDGVHRKPEEEDAALLDADELKRIDQRRGLSYRGQSEMLLRHADILVAVADINSQGGAGGALETVRKALEFNLPVVLIDSASVDVHVITTINELERAQLFGATKTHWDARLRQQLHRLLLGAVQPSPGEDDADAAGVSLLEEYFCGGSRRNGAAGGPKRTTLGERMWGRLEKHLRRNCEALMRTETLEPFDQYRQRATSLNYHYTGGYRGTFLWNYVLAVLAVFLAAVSLVLVAVMDSSAVLYTWLVGLAVVKFFIVLYISRSTHKANHGRWNERGVDYRYLAERLRTMYYLPRLGSFHPPAAAAARYASRAVRQSAVDWLFDAIVRGTSPLAVANGGRSLVQAETVTLPNDRVVKQVPILHTEPLDVAQHICSDWVEAQAVYHRRVETSMEGLFTVCKVWGERLSKFVVSVVVLDIILVACKAGLDLPDTLAEPLKLAGAVLIMLTAVLPAVVASLNGIRFQSECRRLADRSDFLRRLLVGSATRREQSNDDKGGFFARFHALVQEMQAAREDPPSDDGSWTISVLDECELVATDLVEEVAEWSVLYVKEVPETG